MVNGSARFVFTRASPVAFHIILRGARFWVGAVVQALRLCASRLLSLHHGYFVREALRRPRYTMSALSSEGSAGRVPVSRCPSPFTKKRHAALFRASMPSSFQVLRVPLGARTHVFCRARTEASRLQYSGFRYPGKPSLVAWRHFCM